MLLGFFAPSHILLSTPSRSSIFWSGDHGLSALFPLSLVKTDIWIILVAPTPTWVKCPAPCCYWCWGELAPCWTSASWVISERPVGSGVSFTPGHEIWCFGRGDLPSLLCKAGFLCLLPCFQRSLPSLLRYLIPVLPYSNLRGGGGGAELSRLDVRGTSGPCEPCVSSSFGNDEAYLSERGWSAARVLSSLCVNCRPGLPGGRS